MCNRGSIVMEKTGDARIKQNILLVNLSGVVFIM